MWELTDLRKSASVLKESDGWLKMSGDQRFLDDDVINIPYVSQTYVKVKDTE